MFNATVESVNCSLFLKNIENHFCNLTSKELIVKHMKNVPESNALPLLAVVLLSPSSKNFQHYDVRLQRKRAEINDTKLIVKHMKNVQTGR